MDDETTATHDHRCVLCRRERDEHAEALCAACAGATAAALMHAPGCGCPCCKTWRDAKGFVGDVRMLPEVREADAFNGGPVT